MSIIYLHIITVVRSKSFQFQNSQEKNGKQNHLHVVQIGLIKTFLRRLAN